MNDERSPRLIDLSHTIEDGMVTYRGLPAPVITDHLTREESRKLYSEGTEFHIGRIEMVANTGTYLDSPFHRYAEGADLSELRLSQVADLEGVVVRASLEKNARAIDAEAFRDVDVKDKAVLVHTGWDMHWRTERYFDKNPYLTRDAVELLRDAGARLVGIDSLNIDDTEDLSRPAHSILLEAGILIVEHLCNLSTLPRTGFRFFAVPVKVKAFGTFPVRAFGIIQR